MHTWAGTLLISAIALAAYTFWIASSTFADPDTFYHAKITELLMRDRAALYDFVWLPFTTLADHYVDHHFLYHVALIPFVYIFGTFTGIKIAAILFASSVIATLYVLLRQLHVRYAAAFALLLLSSYAFSFRMSLVKAPSVALLFVLIGMRLIIHKQRRWLVLLSFLFVWTYGGFIVLPLIALLYGIVHAVYRLPDWKTVFAVWGGTIAGLLIHPSFPNHLYFLWEQIVQIGALNYQTAIGVGGEWYPATPTDLIVISPLISGLFAAALGIILWRQNVSPRQLWLLLLSFGTILFTLKSQRYIEYAIPFTVLASAIILHENGILNALRQRVVLWSTCTHPLARVLCILSSMYVLFITGVMVISNGQNVHTDIANGLPISTYEASGTWLQTHAAKGDVIFHADWDDFPMLFYWAPRGRYIAGVDPTFFYRQNPDLYTEWAAITTGKRTDHLYETLTEQFTARFIFTDNSHSAFKNAIERDGRFVHVYEDAEVTIYRIPRQAP